MRHFALAVVSVGCLVLATPAWAQDPAPQAPAVQPQSLGATPFIRFAAPGANAFLDRTRTHAHDQGAWAELLPSTSAKHTGDAAWQVIHMAPATGPKTNDCQMPVIVGNAAIDPRFGKPVAPSPNPMAKVAVPCHAKR